MTEVQGDRIIFLLQAACWLLALIAAGGMWRLFVLVKNQSRFF